MINNYGLSDIVIKAAYFSLMTAALVLVAMLLMAAHVEVVRWPAGCLGWTIQGLAAASQGLAAAQRFPDYPDGEKKEKSYCKPFDSRPRGASGLPVWRCLNELRLRDDSLVPASGNSARPARGSGLLFG